MKRDRTLDIAKGIAICLVVLGHTFSNDNVVLWFINSFHMPFFFIVSGMLYANKFSGGVTFHVGKMAQKLLIPYVVFDVLFCLYFALFNKTDTFLNLLTEKLRYTILLEGNNATWFLACMFVTELLFFVLLKYVKKDGICVTVIALLMVFSFFDFSWLPVVCKRSMLYVGFLAIGYYAKNILIKKAKWYVVIVAGMLFSTLVIIKNIWGIAWLAPVATVMTGVLGSYILIQVSDIFKNRKIFNIFDFFGHHTMIVLCTHIFVIELLRLIDYKFFGAVLPKLGIAEGFVFSTIVLCVIVPLIPLCGRWLWFLFGQRRARKK